MMQMVGAFAEFERAMIRERTSAGLAATRAEGCVGGWRRYGASGGRAVMRPWCALVEIAGGTRDQQFDVDRHAAIGEQTGR